MPFRRLCSFQDGLAQGWVRVDVAGNLGDSELVGLGQGLPGRRAQQPDQRGGRRQGFRHPHVLGQILFEAVGDQDEAGPGLTPRFRDGGVLDRLEIEVAAGERGHHGKDGQHQQDQAKAHGGRSRFGPLHCERK